MCSQIRVATGEPISLIDPKVVVWSSLRAHAKFESQPLHALVAEEIHNLHKQSVGSDFIS